MGWKHTSHNNSMEKCEKAKDKRSEQNNEKKNEKEEEKNREKLQRGNKWLTL